MCIFKTFIFTSVVTRKNRATGQDHTLDFSPSSNFKLRKRKMGKERGTRDSFYIASWLFPSRGKRSARDIREKSRIRGGGRGRRRNDLVRPGRFPPRCEIIKSRLSQSRARARARRSWSSELSRWMDSNLGGCEEPDVEINTLGGMKVTHRSTVSSSSSRAIA